MTRRSQLGGASRVTSLPCGFSPAISAIGWYSPIIATASGATTAGVLKTLLSVTGKSRLNCLGVQCADATSRNVRVKITIDGTVAFDSTVTCADSNTRIAVGMVASGSIIPVLFQPVDAQSSLLIEFSSSLSESNKLNFNFNYETRQ